MKKRNEEYKQIKKRYEKLFENMLDGFALHKIITDDQNNPIDYEFIEVNPAFCKILNVRKEDIIGKTVLELWPQTEKYWIENYGKVAQTGETMQFENYSSTFNKYFRVQAFSPEYGFFVVIFHDITQLMLKQKELEIAKEKALEKEQLKT
ncbi:MAG: PAS domain-containing protein, partial [Candidatus Thermochlorobacter sp.]